MKAILAALAKVLGGTAVAQLMTLAAMPFISRIYTPEDYGIFGAFVAVSMIVAVISTLQLHQAIILPKTNSHAAGLFWLAALGATVAGGAGALVALGYLTATGGPDAGQAVLAKSLLFGLAVAAVGTGHACQGLAVRGRAFNGIGISSVVKAGVTIFAQVGGGLLASGGSLGLLIGYVAGEVASVIYMMGVVLPREVFSVSITKVRFRVLLRRYKDFVLFGTAQEAMGSASQGLPVMILAATFGDVAAGSYSFAMKVLMAPVNLISGSVRQVLSMRFSELTKRPEMLMMDFRRITGALALPSLCTAILVASYLPDLFVLTFGSAWREAGSYGGALVVWVAFGVFNVPATLLFRVLRRQKYAFFLNLGFLCLRVFVLIVGGFLWSAHTTVATFAGVGVLANAATIAVAARFISRGAR